MNSFRNKMPEEMPLGIFCVEAARLAYGGLADKDNV